MGDYDDPQMDTPDANADNPAVVVTDEELLRQNHKHNEEMFAGKRERVKRPKAGRPKKGEQHIYRGAETGKIDKRRVWATQAVPSDLTTRVRIFNSAALGLLEILKPSTTATNYGGSITVVAG